jgi:hypothetical protein
MALTLEEAAKLSNDVLIQGVIDTIVKEGGLLARLPFIEMVGNSLQYNRETTLPNAQWMAVGDTWQEGTGTVTQKSAVLRILGGDADVDKYLAQSRSNINDLEAEVLVRKAKALSHEFDETVVYGKNSATPNQPDGLHAMISTDATAQQVHAGSSTTPGVLTLAKLDEMIDLVKPGKPDLLMMSRRTRRGLSAYARVLTSPVTFEINQFGQRVAFYDGVPIVVNDFIKDTETISASAYALPTGGTATTVFALKLGAPSEFYGFTNGGLQVERIGALETKDATRHRVKMYVGLALGGPLAIARLDGISSGAVSA